VPEFRPVLPTSTADREFARLDQIARHLRPSAVDLWNGHNLQLGVWEDGEPVDNSLGGATAVVTVCRATKSSEDRE
jgi:hypothetical protein